MDMISPSIAALTPSLTLKVTNRAKAMKASGEEVYGLAGGEPEICLLYTSPSPRD